MEKNKKKVTFKGKPVTLLGSEAKVGERAPNFTVLDNNLDPRSLSDFKGKVLVLSIFPSVDTSVCSTQNKRFNELATEMGSNVQILAISNDLPFALERFCGAEGIDNIETLSDHKEVDFGTKYGFLIEELRLLARGVVVIDQNGIIRYVEYVKEIGNEPDYDGALKAVQDILNS